MHTAFAAMLVICMLTVLSAFMIPSQETANSALKGALKQGGK